MNSYIAKKVKKYVIATLDSPTKYLKSLGQENGFIFTDNIEYATKAVGKFTADTLLECFYAENNIETELVILPVVISYELINEFE